MRFTQDVRFALGTICSLEIGICHNEAMAWAFTAGWFVFLVCDAGGN